MTKLTTPELIKQNLQEPDARLCGEREHVEAPFLLEGRHSILIEPIFADVLYAGLLRRRISGDATQIETGIEEVRFEARHNSGFLAPARILFSLAESFALLFALSWSHSSF